MTRQDLALTLTYYDRLTEQSKIHIQWVLRHGGKPGVDLMEKKRTEERELDIFLNHLTKCSVYDGSV